MSLSWCVCACICACVWERVCVCICVCYVSLYLCLLLSICLCLHLCVFLLCLFMRVYVCGGCRWKVWWGKAYHTLLAVSITLLPSSAPTPFPWLDSLACCVLRLLLSGTRTMRAIIVFEKESRGGTRIHWLDKIHWMSGQDPLNEWTRYIVLMTVLPSLRSLTVLLSHHIISLWCKQASHPVAIPIKISVENPTWKHVLSTQFLVLSTQFLVLSNMERSLYLPSSARWQSF